MKEIKCLEEITTFTVKFGGKNSIDAENFSAIIQNTISLMKESANTLCPEAFLKLEIRANKEGSFLTTIDTIVKTHPDLINDLKLLGECGAGVISSGVGILSGVLIWLKIKEHLKGQKAKQVIVEKNDATIINADGEKLTEPKQLVNKYFEHNNIDNMIVNIFNNAKADNRTNFEVIPDAKSGLSQTSFNQEKFDNMSKSLVDDISNMEHIVQAPIEATLLIKKPDLLGKSQWVFLYNKTINAHIKDEDFLNKIQDRHTIKICGGFKLRCLLQMEYDLSNGEIIEGSDKYSIIKVLEVIEPPVQQSIFTQIDMK